jgi:hypothetical protein
MVALLGVDAILGYQVDWGETWRLVSSVAISAWAVVIPVLTVVSVLVAVYAARVAARNVDLVRQTLAEMRLERLERSRPVILVDFHPQGAAVYCFVVNIGPGSAYDVAVTFDPVPVDYKGIPLPDWALFQRPIPVLHPSREHKRIYHPTRPLLTQASVVRRFTATVRYRGDGGLSYEHAFCFALDQIAETGDAVVGEGIEPRLDKIALALRDIKTAIGAVRDALPGARRTVIGPRRPWWRFWG